MSHDLLDQLLEFTIKHWWMVAAFVALLIWLFVEEVRSKAFGAAKISSQQLTHGMNRDQLVVIDVRDASLFREGHIINSINLPASEFDRNPVIFDKYKIKEIVLVDASGSKSSTIATQLRNKGFEKVRLLNGGIATWKQDNMPLVKGK